MRARCRSRSATRSPGRVRVGHRDELRSAFRDSRGGDPVSGADLFGLIVSALVCVYLLYALLRGERL